MAAIVLKGPKALDAARKFKKALGWPAWDLSPAVVETVRIDVADMRLSMDAIKFIDRVANDPDIEWISHDGWEARYQTPVEADIEGVPL
jgi:hypothetical protein